MKRILITGGTGFFGKSILAYVKRHPFAEPTELTILARHPEAFVAAYPELAVQPNVQFLAGDVRDCVIPNIHFDAIIHAATPARMDVPDDEMESVITMGTRHMLELARQWDCKKFMFISSGAVYGRGFHEPISEEVEPHPVTVYGKAKLAAERMCVDSGIPTFLPRCFSFVGPYLDRNAHFAIGNFIRDCLVHQPIIIKGDGTPVRSYLYADDLVEWLFTLLDRGTPNRPYNVGSDQSLSIRALAETISQFFKSPFPVQILGTPVPGAADYYIPDISRICRECHLPSPLPLLSALQHTLSPLHG